MDIWNEIVTQAQKMSTLEILGVTFGVMSVWFSKKENILVYPTGIISVLIYVYLCFTIGLYADMGINVFYFGMSVYGWVNWSAKGKRSQNEEEVTVSRLSITRNSATQNLFNLGLILFFWAGLYFILIEFTDSTVPILDSFTTAVCLVGMWLMAQKKLENWIMWIIADLISVPLYWYKEMHLTSIQFALFTLLAISGYLEWKRKLQAV